MTRKQASEKIGFISENRLEKIESRKSVIEPSEVLAMEEAYRDYTLANAHCTQCCAIGRLCQQPLEQKSLSDIAVKITYGLLKIDKLQEGLLEKCLSRDPNSGQELELHILAEQLRTLGQAGRELDLWLKNRQQVLKPVMEDPSGFCTEASKKTETVSKK